MIQIMGSWCPNCLDETNYFKVLHQKYGESGLQIIALGFESQKTIRKRKKHLKRFKDKVSIPYPVYLAGNASKKKPLGFFQCSTVLVAFPLLYLSTRKVILFIFTLDFMVPELGFIMKDIKRKRGSNRKKA